MSDYQDLAWIAAAIYCTIPCFWFVAHGFVEHWRKRGVRAYKPLLICWTAFILTALSATWRWRHASLYIAHYIWVAGAICWIAGLAIYLHIPSFGMRRFIGLAELSSASPDDTSELVTTGMHARVRHPIYSAHLLNLIGLSITSTTIACLALLAFAIITGAVMLRLEERELIRRFGESYRGYMQRTPQIIPWHAPRS